MKIATIIARIVLGLIFVFFGANGIHPFLPMPPMPPSDATTFSVILMTHKYMTVVAVFQFIGGLLLLIGRYVPLGLTILAPILVNILLFHFLLMPEGVAIGLVCAAIEIFLIFVYREAFEPLWQSDARTTATL